MASPGANSETKIMAYGFYYDLNLFSDFTYYLVDPYKGDQFEQQDRRWVAGFDFRRTISGEWYGRKVETTFGMQLRNDWVHNGLYRTEDRVRTSKTYYTANYQGDCDSNGYCSTLDQVAVLPAATDLNKFTETIGSPWVESKIQWASKCRSILALRGDYGKGIVTSFTNPTNPNYPFDPYPPGFNPDSHQSIAKFLPSPKASLIFGPWANTELYLQGGFSYHTNDVRGSTQRTNRSHRTILTTIRRTPFQYPFWSKPKAGKSACALWPSPTCKALVRSGISTVIPSCCRMATPEVRLPQLSQATVMAWSLRTTTRHRNIGFSMLTLRTPAPFLPRTTHTIRRSITRTQRTPSSFAQETRIALG